VANKLDWIINISSETETTQDVLEALDACLELLNVNEENRCDVLDRIYQDNQPKEEELYP